MPFKSKKQWKAAFGGFLGSEMKSKAEEFTKKSPPFKDLPVKLGAKKKKK